MNDDLNRQKAKVVKSVPEARINGHARPRHQERQVGLPECPCREYLRAAWSY